MSFEGVQREEYSITDVDTQGISVVTASGPTRVTWDDLHAACEAAESTDAMRAIYRRMRHDAGQCLVRKYPDGSWLYHDRDAGNRVMGLDAQGRRIYRRSPPTPGDRHRRAPLAVRFPEDVQTALERAAVVEAVRAWCERITQPLR